MSLLYQSAWGKTEYIHFLENSQTKSLLPCDMLDNVLFSALGSARF